MNVLEVENLTFAYGAQPIISQVNFTVNRGQFVALIGSNGAGKSTLLKLLLRELTPSQGAVRLFEQDSRGFRDWHRIGYVPQNRIIGGAGFPATAEEIVKANLFSEIGLFGFPKREHRDRVYEALELVGLAGKEKSLIGTLSGGQQQRVMIARVLVARPQFMLLDEPTTGIDAQTALALYGLLKQLNQETGLTILMVTHDLARASSYVDRTLCLEEGSLLELAPHEIEQEISNKHPHPHSHAHGSPFDQGVTAAADQKQLQQRKEE